MPCFCLAMLAASRPERLSWSNDEAVEVRASAGCCWPDRRRSALADLRSVLSIFFRMFSVSAKRACSAPPRVRGSLECPALDPLRRDSPAMEAERLACFCWHSHCQWCHIAKPCFICLDLHAVADLHHPPAAHLEVLFECIKPQAQRFELLVRVHARGSHHPLLDLPYE